ncbi:uncharacterized protein LOC133536641 [Nerophis ophidion]|uniref:uncharacterized protein LOC133536641 n=1 Tax=Nerophis ophidion TaxID=159077 RepID=UPI002ADF1451|nr:uncharacterized protein LOC133536641 [Nerophis ophidion]
MSQSEKVLHLYLQVRSTSAPNGGKETFGVDEKGAPVEHSGLEDGAEELLSQLSRGTTCQSSTGSSAAPHLLPEPCGSQLQPASSSSPVTQCQSQHYGMVPSSKFASTSFKKEIPDGKSSVVTFRYVHKSNVKTLGSPAYDPHSRQQSPGSSCSSSPKLTFPPLGSPGSHQQRCRNLHPAAADPLDQAVTQRDLEEFGSPLLKLKLAHALQNSSLSRNYHPTRCQSWARSPVQHHNDSSGTWQSQNPLHRSVRLTPERPPDSAVVQPGRIIQGLNQLSDVRKCSSCWLRPKEPQARSPTGSGALQSLKMNIPVPISGRALHQHQWHKSSAPASTSPFHPARVHRRSHPPTEFSSPLRDPGLSLAKLRAVESPTLHRCQTPQYGRRDKRGAGCRERGEYMQPVGQGVEGAPVGQGVEGAPVGQGVEGAPVSQGVEGAPVGQGVEGAPVGQGVEGAPVGQGVEGAPVGQGVEGAPVGQTLKEDRGSLPGPSLIRAGEQTWDYSPLSLTTRNKQSEQRRRERLLLGPVVPDSPDEDEECVEEEEQQTGPSGSDCPPETIGRSSGSSSGVTGSVGDQDCASPESLQSSHRGNETMATTSGIQTDSVSPVPSLHCQKIARAKWEFLFGPEEGASSGPRHFLEASTAPPSGNSSESPTASPTSSLPPLTANQEVQHVEVELVSAPPTSIGMSPKTGIIRGTLKYSETDLDAVPLRCYRETDMDEVLLAEQEDADSAFGSNRSVQAGGRSPLRGVACLRPQEEEGGRSPLRGGACLRPQEEEGGRSPLRGVACLRPQEDEGGRSALRGVACLRPQEDEGGRSPLRGVACLRPQEEEGGRSPLRGVACLTPQEEEGGRSPLRGVACLRPQEDEGGRSPLRGVACVRPQEDEGGRSHLRGVAYHKRMRGAGVLSGEWPVLDHKRRRGAGVLSGEWPVLHHKRRRGAGVLSGEWPVLDHKRMRGAGVLSGEWPVLDHKRMRGAGVISGEWPV